MIMIHHIYKIKTCENPPVNAEEAFIDAVYILQSKYIFSKLEIQWLFYTVKEMCLKLTANIHLVETL